LDILGLELKEMRGLGIELELAGFDIRELNSLLRTTSHTLSEPRAQARELGKTG
jgi:hypothetical protein